MDFFGPHRGPLSTFDEAFDGWIDVNTVENCEGYGMGHRPWARGVNLSPLQGLY